MKQRDVLFKLIISFSYLIEIGNESFAKQNNKKN